MRTSYDLGSLFGIDFASDNSYSAIVDINICSMFCATPAALDEYFDKKAIEGGNITRTILCKLEDDLGEDGAIFIPYSSEQRVQIEAMLTRLMNETYDNDGGLQPTLDLDMSWLDKTVCQWVRDTGKEASLSGSQALDVFRKRSSVSAFRIAALSQYQNISKRLAISAPLYSIFQFFAFEFFLKDLKVQRSFTVSRTLEKT